MQDPMLVVGFLAILCVIYVADRLVQWRRNANVAPLPPGPKGLPLVGNLRDLPEPGVLEAEHWAKLAEYGKLSYSPTVAHMQSLRAVAERTLAKMRWLWIGPVSSITIMGNTLIFVNDAQMAIDMLDKRATYSSRAGFNFAGDMCAHSKSFPSMGCRLTRHQHWLEQNDRGIEVQQHIACASQELRTYHGYKGTCFTVSQLAGS